MIPTRFMFIAGEASGDTLGAELVRALHAAPELSKGQLQFFGAGGPKMQSAGVDLAFDLTTHAVVGIVEVLKNYKKFKSFFDQLLDLARQRKPEVIVLIDYPGFNLRFAHALKALVRKQVLPGWNPKVVFYVSPQIWAWHESRIHQIAEDIDLLLAIFPFEQEWYRRRKPEFRVQFVGHPLIDRFRDFQFKSPDRNDQLPLVLLLPGSRVRELRKHLPPMLEAVGSLRQRLHLRFRMVLPSPKLLALAQNHAQGLPDLEVTTGNLAQSLAESSAAIASSGTVTMECAYFRVPTVVLYKTSWSTYLLGKKFISVKFLAMPNLLAGKQVFPEFIQNEASGPNLAAATAKLLTDAALRAEIRSDLDQVIKSLGEPGASSRAANAILSLFNVTL